MFDFVCDRLEPKMDIQETERLRTDPVAGITAEPYPNNPRHFDILVKGLPTLPALCQSVHSVVFMFAEFNLLTERGVFWQK